MYAILPELVVRVLATDFLMFDCKALITFELVNLQQGNRLPYSNNQSVTVA